MKTYMTAILQSKSEREPSPNKAQHSDLVGSPHESPDTTGRQAAQWYGAYDAQGKLRATFDSEPEAYFYLRKRGHVNGGTYKAIENEVQP